MSAILIDNYGYSKEQLDRAFETISCRGNDITWKLNLDGDTIIYFRGFNVNKKNIDVITDAEGSFVFLDGYYHGQSSRPQEDLIYELYENSFENVVKRLEGKFFLASYSDEYHLLYMARCKWGMVSMYYFLHSNGRITMASEKKALVDLGISFNSIKLLEAKKYYTLNTQLNEFKDWGPYYTIPKYEPLELEPEQYSKDLEYIIEESTRNLVQDLNGVPVASLLGGVDSALVALALNRQYSNVHYYTSGIKTAEDPVDLIYAKVLTESLGKELHTFIRTAEEFNVSEDDIRRALYCLEADNKYEVGNNLLYTALLKQVKSDDITVVFNGNFNDAANATAADLVAETKKNGFTSGKYRGIQLVDNPQDFLYTNKEVSRLGMQDRAPLVYTRYIEYCYRIPYQYYNDLDKPFSRLILKKYFNEDFYTRRKGIPSASAKSASISRKVDTSIKNKIFEELFSNATK